SPRRGRTRTAGRHWLHATGAQHRHCPCDRRATRWPPLAGCDAEDGGIRRHVLSARVKSSIQPPLCHGAAAGTRRTTMRDLIVSENITLDGVIDLQDGWFSPYGGDDITAVNREHMAAADAVLLGRVTYEEFAGYWPAQAEDTTGVSDYLNRTMKYVVSS